MALEIKSFGAVEDSSSKLSSAANKYNAALTSLKEKIGTFSWEGQDAAAYKERVNTAITKLEEVGASLSSQATYLQQVVNVIRDAQTHIARQIRG